ncbi:MAG: exodeoxyribonuclease V subunit beta [Leptospirales bacterium]|nr:exodeoxyribonuclease V subunit beta [Leptospirales bacterium]
MKRFDPHEIDLSGTKLIEASAGTGKTYSIALLVLRLIAEKNIPLKEIAVVTFTKDAASELRERIRNFIATAVSAQNNKEIDNDDIASIIRRAPASSAKNLREALYGIDEASIFTIHGFCLRVLEDNAFETGNPYDSEMMANQDALLEEICADFYRSFIISLKNPVLTAHLANKFKLAAIKKFAASTISRPLAELRYPKDNGPEKFTELFNGLKSYWNKSSAAVKDFFKDYPKVTEEHYRAMDEIVSGESADIKAINFFSTKSMKKLTKKKITPHELCEICDKLLNCLNEIIQYYKGTLHGFLKQELERRKLRLNIQYYDDLLSRLFNALNGERKELIINAVRQKYKAAFIDEFQDTDVLQYSIFKTIFSGSALNTSHGILFLIGDPKQSIYGFRGADIFTYMDAAASFDKLTLSKNYRSESRLVNAFNRVFGIDKPFLYEKIGYEQAEAAARGTENLTINGKEPKPLIVWNLESDKPILKPDATDIICNAVTQEIIRLISQAHIGTRMVTPSDIAILAESHYHNEILKERLLKENIQAVINGGGNIFATDEAYEMLLFLRAVAEPSNERFIKGVLIADLIGYSFEDINTYNRSDSMREEIIGYFRELGRMLPSRGFAAMFMEFQRAYKIRARLIAMENGERKLTNILHIAELLTRESAKKSGIFHLLRWLSERIDSSDEKNEEHELRLENDENAVKLVTVHGSKGLEYPIVFCPFMWGNAEVRDKNAFFYHEEDNGKYKEILCIDSNEDALNQAEQEQLSDKLRLFYVALTRAVHRCYIAWGDINNTNKSSSDYFRKKTQLADDPDILVASPPAFTHEYKYKNEPREELILPEFTSVIPRGWKVSSFSSLSAAAHATDESPADHDMAALNPAEEENSGSGIFLFPRGAQAGIALHEIFELLDFSSEDNSGLIKDILDKYNLSGPNAENIPIVEQTIEKVLRAPLPVEPSFSLRDIKNRDKKTELEFYFSVKQGGKDFNFPEATDSFEPFEGYMRGFIDLVFRKNDVYYICDWKSNYLGGSAGSYRKEALENAMLENKYNLQYMIYALALHRYLKSVQKDYSYDRHFGGIFYFFLRGASNEDTRGIYYTRPNFDEIEKMEGLL